MVTLAFAWAKVKITYYLKTIPVIGLQVGLSIQINKLMKFNEYQRSRSLFDLNKRSCRSQNQNLFFSETVVIWNQISYEILQVNGNENLYKRVGSDDLDGHHAHIW